MTGRGKAGTPIPPLLPPRDLTLTTRPVPQERLLDIRSVGPGAAPDITDTAEPFPDLKDRAGPFSARDRCGDAMNLLDKLDGLRDPTWGFYVFVTSYTEAAMDNVEPAAQKLVEVVRRVFAARAHPALGAEAYKRFRLDLVQDRDALEGASDDRIREEFNALLRGHGLWPEGCSTRGPLRPARRFVCLVFDEATILELASLSFPQEVKDDYGALENVTIKIIDRAWHRPTIGRGSYPGVDRCPVYGLVGVYHMTGDGDSGSMKDMYPMSRCFY
ncbi:hypothetical protein CEP51_002410 [Fusarium floridanum]|uniref:Uncharacterized protein n=1 Tax=Fusarium floridanum TaxID=1325733 RepID=A0A428SBF3_9HYPO|nr:hypothetical protein CEP51_002410 [Fusarium floridanum]